MIALDVLWVLGSVALLATSTGLTTAGQWAVGLVALAVADFATFQAIGWRGMHRRAAEPLRTVAAARAA